MLTHIKIKIVSFLKHSSSYFLNMSQSPPKDFSYLGLLLHSPLQRSQVTTLALPTNASAIDQPNLSHQRRRDVRVVQWSNRIRDWEDIQKKLMTHIPTESARTTTQFRDK